MANYHSIKNAAILTPSTNTDLGSDANRYSNVYMSGNIVMSNGVTVTSTNAVAPRISSITYVGDDTAADPAGGQTITLNGSGFGSGAAVYIGGSIASAVTRISSTQITFNSPAKSAGSYTLNLVNTDGASASYIAGMQYSGVPAWSTSAGSLGSMSSGGSANFTVTATGDAPVSYSIVSGALPSGLSLNSASGAITGTAPSVANETTYNFTIRATDAQNQDTDRNFSVAINSFGTYLTTDLFMHYDFSNSSCYSGSGSTVTDLQGTRNGTITGATYGGTGLAKYFDFEADSINNYIVFGSNIPTGQSTSALSIEVWIYTESMAGTYMSEGIGAIMSSQQDSGNNGASLNTDTRAAHGGGPNCFHPQIGNGSSWSTGNYNTPSGTCGASTRWDHIVMTWSNGNPVDVYKNGIRISNNNTGWSATINWSNCYWSLGQQQCNTGAPSKRAYDGKIAIARIYNRGLSSAEITSNYNGQKSRFGL